MNGNFILVCPSHKHFIPNADDIIKHEPIIKEYSIPIVIDMRQYIIQNGDRCKVEVVSPPAVGTLAYTGMQFEYTPPNLRWVGHVSFSYRIVNSLTQTSDEKCIHLFIGL